MENTDRDSNLDMPSANERQDDENSLEATPSRRRHLDYRISRRQMLKAGGIAALGLAFHKPIIDTISPKPAFANYAPPGDGGDTDPGEGGQQTVTINPTPTAEGSTKEATLTEEEPDTAYPDLNIEPGIHVISGPIGNQAKRVLIEFDVSSIPSSANILSAELRLFLITSETASGIDIALHRVLDPWDPATVTWNSHLGGMPSIDGTPVAITTVADDAFQFHSWNVTTLVEAWVIGEGNPGGLANNGLLLKGVDESIEFGKIFTATIIEGGFFPAAELVVTFAP